MSKEHMPSGPHDDEVELWVQQHEVPRKMNRFARAIDLLGAYRLPNTHHSENKHNVEFLESSEDEEKSETKT